MKKNKCFFLIGLWLILFCLQGCNNIQMNVGESVFAPENKQIPIQGTWEIEGYHMLEDNRQAMEEINLWLGQIAIFNKEVAILGDETCSNPEYKFKNISARDYFLYTHKIHYGDLKIERGNIDVISISDKDKHFYDFVILKDKRLIVCIDRVFYFLKAISNESERSFQKFSIMADKEMRNESADSGPEMLRSGVLLGLQSSKIENLGDGQNRSYRTVWIAINNRKLSPIMERSDLLVPRKNGFWILGSYESMDGVQKQNNLFAYPLQKVLEKESALREMENPEQHQFYMEQDRNIFKNILFVGSDYVVAESDNAVQGRNRLQVLPIDNLKHNKGIKLSDIAGTAASEIFANSAHSYLSRLNKDEAEQLEFPEEYNFTLARRNGHWIMLGRIYHKTSEAEKSYFNFSINMIPPDKLVQYDDLQISWGTIKERVPEAVDAYTSPNKDMVIILTQKDIYIYGLQHGIPSTQYYEKINLKKGESVVMAEWAVGNYVERWQDVFRDDGKILKSE